MGKRARPRACPFGAKTAAALDRYLHARARFPKAGTTDVLWIGVRGPLGTAGIRSIVERRGEKAGIGHVHAHLFRHSFAHQWLADGGSENDLMRLVGWRTREMLNRYGASAPDARARAAYQPARRATGCERRVAGSRNRLPQLSPPDAAGDGALLGQRDELAESDSELHADRRVQARVMGQPLTGVGGGGMDTVAAALVASGPRGTTPGLRLAAISVLMDGMASVSQAATSGSLGPCGSPTSPSPTSPSLQIEARSRSVRVTRYGSGWRVTGVRMQMPERGRTSRARPRQRRRG